VQAQATAPVQAQAAAPNLTPAEATQPEKKEKFCMFIIDHVI
jgi:hypothetical protein